ncbi:MAG: hypothetical protein M3036_00520 [Bifidobacteriales bacterium]|nr:hypothetical protein [Bifidobacteriales bacterium]
MSNLGLYQTITTMAKKAGGMGKLIAAFGTATAAAGAGALYTIQKVISAVKRSDKKSRNPSYEDEIFHVSRDYKDDKGLMLKVNDQYKVLTRDGDAVFIEKVGDSNNPYVLSSSTLKKISNFKIQPGK